MGWGWDTVGCYNTEKTEETENKWQHTKKNVREKKRGQDAVGTRGLLKPVGMVKKGIERILENRTT